MNIPAAAGQGGDLSRANTRACLSAAAAQVGLLGTQETSEPEDNEDIDTVLPPADWYHFQAVSECDILVKRNRWAPVLDASGSPVTHRIQLSTGTAHVTPERDLTDVQLTWTDRPDWTPFAFGDSHFVSGVDSGLSPVDVRKKDRDLEMAGLIKWAQAQYDAGRNVIFVADTNWLHMPLPHPEWQWVVNGSIDKVGILNSPGSNWVLSFVSEESYASPSDHRFRVANLLATAR